MQITVDYKTLAISVDEKESLEHQLQSLAEKSKGKESLFVNAVFMVEGHEYNQMKKRVSAFDDFFSSIIYSPAILGNSDRIQKFAEFILREYKITKSKNYLFIGHGTKDSENLPYKKLESVFADADFPNVKIAVLKGSGNIDDYLKKISGKKIDRIEAYPLLINNGEHIKKDVLQFCKSVNDKGFFVEYFGIPLIEKTNFKETYYEKNFFDS